MFSHHNRCSQLHMHTLHNLSQDHRHHNLRQLYRGMYQCMSYHWEEEENQVELEEMVGLEATEVMEEEREAFLHFADPRNHCNHCYTHKLHT